VRRARDLVIRADRYTTGQGAPVAERSGAAEVEGEFVRRRVHELDGDAPVLLVEVAGRVQRDLSPGLTVAGGGSRGHVQHPLGELGIDDDIAAEPLGSAHRRRR
jgi:hypothetical protein